MREKKCVKKFGRQIWTGSLFRAQFNLQNQDKIIKENMKTLFFDAKERNWGVIKFLYKNKEYETNYVAQLKEKKFLFSVGMYQIDAEDECDDSFDKEEIKKFCEITPTSYLSCLDLSFFCDSMKEVKIKNQCEIEAVSTRSKFRNKDNKKKCIIRSNNESGDFEYNTVSFWLEFATEIAFLFGCAKISLEDAAFNYLGKTKLGCSAKQILKNGTSFYSKYNFKLETKGENLERKNLKRLSEIFQEIPNVSLKNLLEPSRKRLELIKKDERIFEEEKHVKSVHELEKIFQAHKDETIGEIFDTIISPWYSDENSIKNIPELYEILAIYFKHKVSWKFFADETMNFFYEKDVSKTTIRILAIENDVVSRNYNNFLKDKYNLELKDVF